MRPGVGLPPHDVVLLMENGEVKSSFGKCAACMYEFTQIPQKDSADGVNVFVSESPTTAS